ncbi:MAG TPA: hypothetical protein VL240_02320 [Candidatus Binatia bacterium]|nr:hypothetical protein [Candidatus Binatia bacterium]
MKSLISTGCLILCLLALLTGASAQQMLNFSDLPLVNIPSPMPSGYGQLDWGNFFFVNPYGWSGAGPGYQLGGQSADVAFIGGKQCRLYGYACYGTLASARGFQLVNARVAGGFGPTAITVSAYNNGTFVGLANYFVTTNMQTLIFPPTWGVVTQVIIQASGESGDLVVYGVSLYTLGG